MTAHNDAPDSRSSVDEVPVIDLSAAPGERDSWSRPAWVVYLWSVIELLIVSNPWQISSSLRVRAIRAFGGEVGDQVIFRPRTRVKFPWNLHIGNRCWIGEGVWFHNQDHVYIGHDAVISQDTFLTTGSHRHRVDMALLTRPIHIEPGAWVTSRCVVLGGAHVGRSSVVSPNSVVNGAIPANAVWSNGRVIGERF